MELFCHFSKVSDDSCARFYLLKSLDFTVNHSRVKSISKGMLFHQKMFSKDFSRREIN